MIDFVIYSGKSITSPENMKEAILLNKILNGVIVEIKRCRKDLKSDKLFKIPNISYFSSFEYNEETITMFLNYNIGTGEKHTLRSLYNI